MLVLDDEGSWRSLDFGILRRSMALAFMELGIPSRHGLRLH